MPANDNYNLLNSFAQGMNPNLTVGINPNYNPRYPNYVQAPYDPDWAHKQTAMPVTGSYVVNQWGGAAVPATEPTLPQIASQETALSNRIDAQEKLLSILEEKLNPVCRLAEGPSDLVPSEPQPTCPLAGRLQGLAIRVQYSNVLLQSLLSRIEI